MIILSGLLEVSMVIIVYIDFREFWHNCYNFYSTSYDHFKWVPSMFAERKVCYSALFTNLVGWHASAVTFPLSDIILAQLACPLSDIMFCLHSGATNLSLYKHWVPYEESDHNNLH